MINSSAESAQTAPNKIPQDKKENIQTKILEVKRPNTELLINETEQNEITSGDRINFSKGLSNFDSNNNKNEGNDIDSEPDSERDVLSPQVSQESLLLQSSRPYGLRPRTEIRKPSYDCEFEEKETPVEVVRRPRAHNRGSLMSKYRRRTANARERHRMRDINNAFTTLRGILPPLSNRRSAQVSMTKIRILRLAANYIQSLSDLLEETGGEGIKPCSISTFSSSLNLQQYSESLLQKIQAKSTSHKNFHSSANFKAKMQRKRIACNDLRGNEDTKEGAEDLKLCSTNNENLIKFERFEIMNPDSNSISDSEITSRTSSWELSEESSCEKDLLSLLEDSCPPLQSQNDTEESLNSWSDYSALEDLYFALN